MAKIQLDQEVLAIETLIEERNHDVAFRRLVLAKDRFARRPEYRYLQALFDATFNGRPIQDLIRDVSALVADQPDFFEAVSLLAVLYDALGDRARAEVFAREAVRGKNPIALERARKVLGGRPTAPPADQMPFRQSGRFSDVSSELSRSGSSAEIAPQRASFTTPSVDVSATAERKSTMTFVAVAPSTQHESGAEWAPERETKPGVDDRLISLGIQRTKTQPPVAPERVADSVSSRPQSQPPAADRVVDSIFQRNKTQPRPQIGSSPEHERLSGSRSNEPGYAETIPFSPSGVPMPPPPTIPPEALAPSSRPVIDPFASSSEAPTAPGLRSPDTIREPADSDANGRAVLLGPGSDFDRPTQTRERKAVSSNPPGALAPDLAIDDTGIGRGKAASVSRPALAAPPPVEQQRHWFRYARMNQISPRPGGGEGGTALMLLDLAERAVLGQTPLCPDPVPLDRRGLIIVEKKLDAQREVTKVAQSAGERAAATTGAAFLLALLMKECDARAVDTTPEDGACKVLLANGSAVRPLLIAAAYMRGRGPGLLETFDRAATAHMRRASQAPPPPQQPAIPAVVKLTPPPMHSAEAVRISEPPATVGKPELALVVGHRELDAGTIALVSEDAPRGPIPRVSLRARAEQFWASPMGREIVSPTRRVGSFVISDVEAVERYLVKNHSPVGLSPPGKAWPWLPDEDQEEQILAWGAVLGEVLNALYGGRWECDPRSSDDLRLARVVLSGGVVAWPMAKVYLRLARGISHDICVFIDSVGRVVARQANSQ